MANYFVLDKKRVTRGVLSNTIPDGCPYFKDSYTEDIVTGWLTHEFEVPADHPEASKIDLEGYIIFPDFKGRQRMVKIIDIDDQADEGQRKWVYAEGAHTELGDDRVRPFTLENGTAEEGLDRVLINSGWIRGRVDGEGTAPIEMKDYPTILEGIQDLSGIFGGLYPVFRVEYNEQTGQLDQIVDLVRIRGRNNGKMFDFSKDLTEITRKRHSRELYTGVLPLGKAEDEQRLTISGISWSTSNGDPVNKPPGEDVIVDPVVTQEWGKDGKPKIGKYENSNQTDPNLLALEGWEWLKEHNKPSYQYTGKAIDIHRLTGEEHEQFDAGDVVAVRNLDFNPPMLVEAEILRTTRSHSDPSADEFEFGNYKDIYQRERDKLDALVALVNRKSGTWDVRGQTWFEGPDAPDPAEYETWLKTGVVPNIWYKWNGSSWIRATSTQPGDVGTISESEINNRDTQTEARAENFTRDWGPKVYSGPDQPTAPIPLGSHWLNEVEKVWYKWDGTEWKRNSLVEFSEFEGYVTNGQIGIGAVAEQQLADLAVSMDKLKDHSVNVDKVVDNAINNAKLALGSVGTLNIVDRALSTAKIQLDAIDNTLMAVDAIKTENIVDRAMTSLKVALDAINNTHLAVDSVNTAQIRANAITMEEMGPGSVGTLEVVDRALSNAKIQLNAIDNTLIAVDAVETENIVNRALTGGKIALDAITNNLIADNAVQTENIVDRSMSTLKIALDAVTNDLIADNAVGSSKIGSGAVTSGKIGSSAVGSGNIASGAVISGKLGSGAVGTTNIVDNAINNAKLASLAVNVENVVGRAITGAKIALTTVDNENVITRTLTADRIVALAITAGEIAGSTITGAKIAGTTITGSNIAGTTITGAKMVAGTVTANEIASRTILAERIVAGAITGNEIAGTTITGAKIQGNTITATQIAGLTITANEIAGTTITGAKMVANTVTATQIAGSTITATQIASRTITADKIVANSITGNEIIAGAITTNHIATAGLSADVIKSGYIATERIKIGSGVTFDEGYDPSQIGGVNIMFTSMLTEFWAGTNATTSLSNENGYNQVKVTYGGSGTNFATQVPSSGRKTQLKQGKKYTLSFEVRGNVANMNYTYLMRLEGANRSFPSHLSTSISETEWTEIVVTQEALWDSETGYVLIGTQDVGAGKWFEIRKVQLEEGDKKSSWGLNPLELNMWRYQNTTFIDGGNIYTNSIVANSIASGTITATEIATRTIIANRIATGAITANEIAGTTITGNKIVGNTITATQIAGSTITASQIASRTITADRIVANAITANEIASNTITASQIASNSITADVLQAGIISAREMVVGSFDNLIADPNFTTNYHTSNGITNGGGTSVWEVVPTSLARSGGNVLRYRPGGMTANAQCILSAGNVYGGPEGHIPASEGEKYHAEIWVRRVSNGGVTAPVRICLSFRDSNGTQLGASLSNAYTPNTSYNRISIVGTCPAGTSYVVPYVRVDNTSGANDWSYFDNVFVRRMMEGSLVVDGTITATQIATNTVTATEIASRTITSGQIVAGTITANEIATRTITANRIATGAITANEIQAGSITTNHIATAGLTADVIKGGTISGVNILGDNTVIKNAIDVEGSSSDGTIRMYPGWAGFNKGSGRTATFGIGGVTVGTGEKMDVRLYPWWEKRSEDKGEFTTYGKFYVYSLVRSNYDLAVENGIVKVPRIQGVSSNDFFVGNANGRISADSSGTRIIHSPNNYSMQQDNVIYFVQNALWNIYLSTQTTDNNHANLRLGNARLKGLATTSGSMQVRTWDDSAYGAIRASSFDVSSKAEEKDNIIPIEFDALQKVSETPVYSYTRNHDRRNPKYQIGLLWHEAPDEMKDDETVDLYSMTGVLWRSNQQLLQLVRTLESRVTELEGGIANVKG